MIVRLVVGLLLVLAPAALARAEPMTMTHGMHGTAHVLSPAEKANAAAMATMMKAMDAKPTGDPDKDFARMMLPHHQGALEMAQTELRYGKDPELVAMARAIVEAQTREIDAMKAWLAKHGT